MQTLRTRILSAATTQSRKERRRVGYRSEVGRDLRARRGRLCRRAARNRFHLHRGADLAPDGAGPLLLRHAGRHPAEGHAGRHGDRGQEPVVQVQRDDPRCGPQPARLRARHELARARAPRRRARDPGVPLRGQVPEQPERRDRPLGRDDLLLRPVVRALSRLRDRARAGARLAGRLPDPARRRAGRAAARRREGRVRDAERAVLLPGRVAPLRQRHAGGVTSRSTT